jgi:tetratricopeptide (TPR) repeat protein
MNTIRKAILSLALSAIVAAAQAPAPAARQPKPKSQKEVEAIQAIFAAQDPDSRIKLAEELITKFADTEFKALALQIIAMSYQQKNDVEKMILYSERVLEAEPKNYSAMLMIAGAIAQRTREHDLDREEKLGQAEKYARDAMEILKTAPKPRPDITDEQWQAAKKDFNAQAHEALGMAAMARKKYDVAITELKASVEEASQPDPATMVRLGAVYNMTGKPDEAVAIIDKALAVPDLNPQIRQFATNEKIKANQAKAGAKPAPPAGQPSTQPPPPPPAPPKP